MTQQPLYTGSDWSFEKIDQVYQEIEKIGVGEMGLSIYPNQIEVITAEQMLDCYASIGMPQMYRHWSFGKHFIRDEQAYRKGARGLAFEIVINSNPCINYIMEENTMTMQTLVIAHAAMGHNHFFKNNYLFRQWTQADAILEYLSYAKKFIAECEEKYGEQAVDDMLTAAHALMNQGVNKSQRKRNDPKKAKKREHARKTYEIESYNQLWSTLPKSVTAKEQTAIEKEIAKERTKLDLPEENILYFLEKHSLKLELWQREILRIVRSIAQYFYPQRQTKVMNEGCATFVHYEIFNRMNERGLVDNGAMMEFLHMHTAVIAQPSYESKYFSGFNPYALGFAMMQDIKRICLDPTEEDREWFPDFAGNPDYMGVLRHAWKNYRDESFILQFLSPKVIRDFRMLHLADTATAPAYGVGDIHDETGYKNVRRNLAAQYDPSKTDSDIQVTSADLTGSRCLEMTHTITNGTLLEKNSAKDVMQYIAQLWGYKVRLNEVNVNGTVVNKYEMLPMP